MFDLIFNEHRGKTAAVSGIITAILSVLCCYGNITSEVMYNVCAWTAIAFCVIGVLCFTLFAVEEWS